MKIPSTVRRIAGLAIVVVLLAVSWIIDNTGVNQRGPDLGEPMLRGIVYGLLYIFAIFTVFAPLAWLAYRLRKSASNDST